MALFREYASQMNRSAPRDTSIRASDQAPSPDVDTLPELAVRDAGHALPVGAIRLLVDLRVHVLSQQLLRALS